MGVGKTTFVRSLLKGLGVIQPPEGSPSFAIAHEYQAPIGGIVHIDFYRLRSELEIDEAGIPAYYWERNLIVISEWLSNWQEFHQQVLGSGRAFEITLAFQEDHPMHRKVKIQSLGKL
jgi:tRNA threonylcarbamoyl adenosine modification protein YjeE